LASSVGKVKEWAKFVGDYGKTPESNRKAVACFDMEGHASTHPPYAASLLGKGSAVNLTMNPLRKGALSTEKECRVCS
jgi:hypothetical protein